MNLREGIQKFLRGRGYSLTPYPVKHFFRLHDFDVVLDVGANVGQYGNELRKECEFKKRIVSFEPMAEAFAKLSAAAQSDPLWTPHHCGLGHETGSQTINVAGNSASSSLFDMLPSHTDVVPTSAYVKTEQIEIRRLDDMFGDVCFSNEKVLLKIDTQGFEMEVLSGAAKSLDRVAALQLELSLSPLYAGAPLLEDVIGRVRQHGFVPYWFFHGFKNHKTMQLLQIDGLFVRPSSLPVAS